MPDKADDIFNAVRNAKDKDELAKKLGNKLSPDQSKRVKKLLGDENALKKLLNNSKVKDIINKITEEDNGFGK